MSRSIPVESDRSAAVRPVVRQVLRSPGQPLDTATRAFMQPRFGHDFNRVRVHADAQAAESARAANALAYTVGHDVVFAAGRYAPNTTAGQRLLAHELAHVVQQGASGARSAGDDLHVGSASSAAEIEARRTAAHLQPRGSVSPGAAVPPGTIQRENGEAGAGDDEERYRLRWPGLPQGPSAFRGRTSAWELRLDPQIQAQIAAIRMMQELLDADRIRSSLLRVDFSTLLATQPPPWLATAPTPTPGPLVPRGAGPSTPRAGTGGDVARALLSIPTVDSALTRLRAQAGGQVRRDWRRLSTGEQVLVITQSALITGGALAGVLSTREGREFSLSLIQNRDIPIPGVPGLTFQFNVTGPDQMIRFDLNVGALLPSSLGFR